MRLLAALLLFASPVVAQPLVLEGSAEAEGDFLHVAFEVPDGVAELEVAHDDLSDRNVLDFGLMSPSGFRGWGGGNPEPAVVGERASSRSYLAGPIEAGTWQVIIGRARITDPPGEYRLEVTFRDEPTLPEPPLAPYVPVAPLSDEARYYAGDFHVHSRESGDASASFDDIAALARERGLDFVVITDHNTVSHLELLADAQARHPDVLLVPGIELTTYQGHAGVFGARAWVDHRMGHDGRDMTAALADVVEQGALFSVNHPVLDLGDTCIGCAWLHDVDLQRAHGVEIQTGASPLFTEDAIAFWDVMNDRGARLAAIGGSDDHQAGIDLGFGQSPIGSPTTLVFATELSEAAILAGVRAARTVVKLSGPDAPMLTFDSEPPAKADAPVVTGDAVTFTATVEGLPEEATTLRILKDGLPVDGGDFSVDEDPFTASFDVTADPGARYRAELVRSDDGRRLTVTSDLWIERPLPPPPGCACGAAGAAGFPLGLAFLVVGTLLWACRRRSRRL